MLRRVTNQRVGDFAVGTGPIKFKTPEARKAFQQFKKDRKKAEADQGWLGDIVSSVKNAFDTENSTDKLDETINRFASDAEGITKDEVERLQARLKGFEESQESTVDLTTDFGAPAIVAGAAAAAGLILSAPVSLGVAAVVLATGAVKVALKNSDAVSADREYDWRDRAFDFTTGGVMGAATKIFTGAKLLMGVRRGSTILASGATGAAISGIHSGAYGALKEDKGVAEVLGDTIAGTATGFVGGAAFGGLGVAVGKVFGFGGKSWGKVGDKLRKSKAETARLNRAKAKAEAKQEALEQQIIEKEATLTTAKTSVKGAGKRVNRLNDAIIKNDTKNGFWGWLQKLTGARAWRRHVLKGRKNKATTTLSGKVAEKRKIQGEIAKLQAKATRNDAKITRVSTQLMDRSKKTKQAVVTGAIVTAAGGAAVLSNVGSNGAKSKADAKTKAGASDSASKPTDSDIDWSKPFEFTTNYPPNGKGTTTATVANAATTEANAKATAAAIQLLTEVRAQRKKTQQMMTYIARQNEQLKSQQHSILNVVTGRGFASQPNKDIFGIEYGSMDYLNQF